MSSPVILVVDDQQHMRSLISSLLAPLQAEISEAENGMMALDLLRKGGKYDLILTDIAMPEMDGYAFCSEVKKDERLQRIPVIMISTFDSDASVEQGFDSGASAFISKTVLREQLLEVTNRVLERSRFFSDKKILLVDSSPVVVRVVKDHLSQSGFTVGCVRNGTEALNKLARDRFDLIIADLHIPEMQQLHFIERLRADDRLRSIPLMVMHASASRQETRELMNRGVVAFISKPFHPEELIVLLDRIFSEQYQLLRKENEMLARERELMIGSIASLAQALEARDPCTMGHSDSVATIVTGMARYAGVGDDDLKTLEIAARLHDIGKIGISDEVLLKKGKLTCEEFDHIKSHPETGARILHTVEVFKDIIPTVLHHHERYDGNGYPHGLSGENIPFWARMTAVADTFDAMTSDRPYREGIPVDTAIGIIRQESGSQFCPACVALFLQWAEEQFGYKGVIPEMTGEM